MKKKNKFKYFIIRLLIAITLILAIIYVIYEVGNLLVEPTEIVTVENSNISSEIMEEGYIIREETVLKGQNYKNGMMQIKLEGEKIAKNENVFRYYTKDEEDLNKKIKELDNKIAEAQSKENNIFSSDLKVIENEIETKVYEMKSLNDTKKLKEYENDIQELVKKKTRIIGELSPSGSYLKDLIQKRSDYENKLNSGSEYMKSNESGMVSYKVDGLEDTLNISSLEDLTEEKLENLNLKTNEIISTSIECGKIVNNYYCYIVSFISEKDISNIKIKEGDKLTLRLINGDEISVKVEKIKLDKDNKYMFVFKTTKDVEELIDYRKINFDLIYWNYTGLKVPNSSIIKENELNYVVRMRAGYKDKILVKIEKQNDTYSIISNYTTEELKEMGWTSSEIANNKNIGLYDQILVNPNN